MLSNVRLKKSSRDKIGCIALNKKEVKEWLKWKTLKDFQVEENVQDKEVWHLKQSKPKQQQDNNIKIKWEWQNFWHVSNKSMLSGGCCNGIKLNKDNSTT